MNEQIISSEAMGVLETPKAVRKILDSMIDNRGRSKVEAKPYVCGLFRQEALHDAYQIDLEKCYPDAKSGESVYASSDIYADCDSYGMLSVNSDVRVWLGGEEVFAEHDGIIKGEAEEFGGIYRVKVKFKRGKNKLIIKKLKTDKGFNLTVRCSFVLYPQRWSDDYLLCLKATIPCGDFKGFEGFSVSELSEDFFAEDLEKAEVCCFPKKHSYENSFDFKRLYDEGKGRIAYAYTVAGANTQIKIRALSECRVIVNGDVTASLSMGESKSVELKKDDVLLVKSFEGEKWGFEADKNTDFVIPDVNCEERWLCIGPFFTENGSIGERFGVEDKISLKNPYYNGRGESVFWRFNSENLWLRLYTESKFFGQWFYAIMVGLMGIRRSAEVLEDAEAMDYYLSSVRVMSEYFDYAQYDFKKFGSVHLIPRCVKLDTWDDIGTVGMCLCDAYKITSDPNMKRLIDIMAQRIGGVPTFEDGTFYRIHTMWADDFYMSSSFLTRLCELTGDEKYIKMLITQLRGYKKRLWIEEEKIFSHIYFPKEGVMSRVPWGRGNGWVMVSLTEILLHCHDETLRSEALELYREFVGGVVKNQDECGMWHQVLNRPDSYIETSCSAMFALCIARGVNNGWLDKSYSKFAKRAWEGILKRAVDKDGHLYGVCLGSGCHMQAEYYFNIPTHKNDDHGTGIVLAAGCEIIEMEKNI